MKTILIPTDFSPNADHAAFYAFELGKHIKASLKLCNAIMVPAAARMSPQVAWPLMDLATLKKDAELELKKLSKQLQKTVTHAGVSLKEHPPLEVLAEVGTLPEVIRMMAEKEEINLVVMGTSGASGLNKLFLGSTSRDLIENSSLPILLIPPGTDFKPLKRIAFATDLTAGDLALIHSLAFFARPFNAEILIVHISKDDFDPERDQKKIDDFLNEVTCKAHYHKVYYRHVKDMGIDEGLNWLTDHADIDLLAMVHRKHHFIKRLFEGSHTQRMAAHVKLPLLVFPPETHTVL
ncbi:universal stress protein [Pedobacter sp. N36a]|uniref:universal stress protein n=1 Tax=Pedobacter sp. N36a TaxID=2767996 RepID=UPI001657115B|nr:universal stress protein [Pedobacter sp. N36a]MBC8984178.1 universal stress protein [Pedobacter sp. N36a]